MILDRNGNPLAISIPMETVCINPKVFIATEKQKIKLAKLLRISYYKLNKKISENSERYFAYLKRRIRPLVANKIKHLDIMGLFFEREYKRYYPYAEVTSHLLGFTNIDDEGQEGLELAYNSWLQGIPGKEKVVKDRLGHVVANIGIISLPKKGHNLVLSIDERIQYISYYALKKAIEKYKASSGSIIVLDVRTGEVLAMVNWPSYNPNSLPKIHDGNYRNRAVTDVFEPGSTMKTFSIISALESGKYIPETKVDTNPGWYVVDGHTIKDDGLNRGILTLTGILQKSSNIGMAKVTLSIPPENLWQVFHDFGFGQRTDSGFPGEVSGSLEKSKFFRPFVLATLSFGYAMSITPLQLACAYATIASGGIKYPITFLKRDTLPEGKRIISKKIADEMITMLRRVVETGGTGIKANIPGYKVVGKTGTAYMSDSTGYNDKKYVASFVGMAPFKDPKLVVAVVIKNPHGSHFGGIVAAPVFAKVMTDSLRILKISPNN